MTVEKSREKYKDETNRKMEKELGNQRFEQ